MYIEKTILITITVALIILYIIAWKHEKRISTVEKRTKIHIHGYSSWKQTEDGIDIYPENKEDVMSRQKKLIEVQDEIIKRQEPSFKEPYKADFHLAKDCQEPSFKSKLAKEEKRMKEKPFYDVFKHEREALIKSIPVDTSKIKIINKVAKKRSKKS